MPHTKSISELLEIAQGCERLSCSDTTERRVLSLLNAPRHPGVELFEQQLQDLMKDAFVNLDLLPYQRDALQNLIPEACRGCSNHPINGGSGICHCILGIPKITC